MMLVAAMASTPCVQQTDWLQLVEIEQQVPEARIANVET
jgi:hypothetical protein